MPPPNQNTTAPLIKGLGEIDKLFGKLVKSSLQAQIGLNIFVTSLDKAISQMGSQFTKFVQLANPATVIRACQHECIPVRHHLQHLQGRRAFEDRIVPHRDVSSPPCLQWHPKEA